MDLWRAIQFQWTRLKHTLRKMFKQLLKIAEQFMATNLIRGAKNAAISSLTWLFNWVEKGYLALKSLIRTFKKELMAVRPWK